MSISESLASLSWRYAVKKFDPKKKLSEEQLHLTQEVLRLSASSFGIQPWRFIFVSDAATKEKLIERAMNQPQVRDCSSLVVLCRTETCNAEDVDRYIESMAHTRGMTKEKLAKFEVSIKEFLVSMKSEQIAAWMEQQVFIALGGLLTVCAQHRIDSCPMGGFERDGVDEVLGLRKQGLRSVVLCALGFRAVDDKYASLKKVRYIPKDVIRTV